MDDNIIEEKKADDKTKNAPSAPERKAPVEDDNIIEERKADDKAKINAPSANMNTPTANINAPSAPERKAPVEDDNIIEERKADDKAKINAPSANMNTPTANINTPSTPESEAPVEVEEYELEEEETLEEEEEYTKSIDETPEISEENLEEEKMVPPVYDMVKEKEMINQAKRQRRLKGSIILGSGVTLFVILWLITVQQVFYANDPISEIFEISMMIVIIAGLLFVVGMYLLVSRPHIEISK